MEQIKQKIFILDTSAILSGKPICLDDSRMVTTPGVSDELKPGGRDYQMFQFLKEKGLVIHAPSKKSIDEINIVSTKSGDAARLSDADKEVLALALDLDTEGDKEIVILTDDYSIQNVAHIIGINVETISQKGITKKFKWTYKCSGCGKKFKENIKVCPICGALTKNIVSCNKDISRKKCDR